MGTSPPQHASPPAESEVLAFPASAAQQAFWYLEHLQNGVTAFNIPFRFQLDGPLNTSRLEQSINTIIERHEALRTHFADIDGELLQIVKNRHEIPLPTIELGHIPDSRIKEEIDRLGSIEASRPFDLATGPVIRTELLRRNSDSHVLHITIHHALFDGLSMTVFTRELATIYQALSDGKDPELTPLPIQYGDFTVWQRELLEGGEMKRQLAYWKNRLKDMAELDLPTDFPRPPVKSWKGDIISTLLPDELTEKLHSIAAGHGATLFHLQLAAYMILLHRYTGSTDIAIGTPVAGRTRDELEPLIGVFINSLILRSDLSENPDFGSFLDTVRETALEALENQELPFEHLVRELGPERDPSRNPLFQVNFSHHRSFAKAGSFGGLSFTPIPSRSPGTIFDLHLFMTQDEEGWHASCDYSTDLFSRASAERMLGHFKHLLEDIADNPQQRIGELTILTDSENATLRKNATHTREYPRDATIGALFLETADRFPDRIALISGDRSYSYQQIRNAAGRLAVNLVSAGVKPGNPVAIVSRPTPEMIVGTLGTLLAGACCAPIDPTYPADHFQFLLNESGATTGLASGGCEDAIPDHWQGTVHMIPAPDTSADPVKIPDVRVTAEHPAHLLFTSGSTGRPKGVLLPHRGAVRLVRNNDFINITPDDVFLQAAPASFDASLLEIWGALLNGGRLVLLPDGPGLESIASAVRKHGVTTLWLSSGLFQVMIDEHADSLQGLKNLLAGGDALSPTHVRTALKLLPDTRLINGYGPTENTTFTTCHEITADDLRKPSIPIGSPIANTTVHILDAQLRPVPVGIPGELCTGGDGLAIGYLNAPDLTSEKFVSHPELGRLYRTGDLCRRDAEGTIEFLGRSDQQVKVRGFRIELGEIESRLAEHPKVSQAKAAVRGESAENKRIFAWIVPTENTTPEWDELTTYLKQSLPAFMQPDGISLIDRFPLNANGKIRLDDLPDPENQTVTGANAITEPPTGRIECQLAAIWQELLEQPEIGRNDDFFALGGHSLMALRMFSRITREWGRSLPLATLLKHPTVATLASLLEPTKEISSSPAQAQPQPLPGGNPGKKGHLVTLNQGANLPPLFCIHGGDGGIFFYRGLTKFMPQDLPLNAIESLELGNSGVVPESNVEDTARAYVTLLLGVRKQGPFRLAGYSFGGVVAHEMACQLVDMGHKVDFLGLFDTHNPTAPTRHYGLAERFKVFWKDTHDQTLAKRVSLLCSRINEGVKTHRQIKTECRDAESKGPAAAFSDLRRVQVREENWRAMQNYQPRPFSGRITLFKTSFVNDKFERPADYGWSEVAQSGLDIVPVTGHHLELFNSEHIATLSTALAESLKRADNPAPPASRSTP